MNVIPHFESNFQPLIGALLLSTAIWIVARVAVAICSPGSAATRHLIWLAAFVAMAAALPITLLHVRISLPILPSPAAEEASIPAVQKLNSATAPAMPATENDGVVAGEPRASAISSVFSFGVWTLGPVLVLLGTVVGWLRLRRVLQASQRVGKGAPFDLLGEACAASGVSKCPALFLSREVEAPLLTGFLHPAIVLPERASVWPAATLRIIFLHELGHLQRKDIVTLAGTRIIAALYWFNPLAWHALRSLRAEAEMAADDHVVLVGSRPVEYAESLVGMARDLRRAKMTLWPAVGILRNPRIEVRVGRILNDGIRRTAPPALLRWGAVASAVLLALGISTIRLVAASPSPEPAVAASAPPAGSAAKTPTSTATPTDSKLVRPNGSTPPSTSRRIIRASAVDRQPGQPATSISIEPGKPVNAQLLLLSVDLKTKLERYEIVSKKLGEMMTAARGANVSEVALRDLNNNLSSLIDEKKSLEESIKTTADEYNKILKDTQSPAQPTATPKRGGP